MSQLSVQEIERILADNGLRSSLRKRGTACNDNDDNNNYNDACDDAGGEEGGCEEPGVFINLPVSIWSKNEADITALADEVDEVDEDLTSLNSETSAPAHVDQHDFDELVQGHDNQNDENVFFDYQAEDNSLVEELESESFVVSCGDVQVLVSVIQVQISDCCFI
jgi:hypothetical protein